MVNDLILQIVRKSTTFLWAPGLNSMKHGLQISFLLIRVWSLLSLFVNNTEAFVDKFKINYVVNFHVGRFINWTSELWTTELIVLRLDFFKCTLPSIIRFVLCVSIVVRVAEKKCLCWEEIWILWIYWHRIMAHKRY